MILDSEVPTINGVYLTTVPPPQSQIRTPS